MENISKEQIDLINKRLYRMVSFRHTFYRGIISGLGTALGATVVAAFAFALLARFVDSVEDVPIIEDVVNEVNLNGDAEMLPQQ